MKYQICWYSKPQYQSEREAIRTVRHFAKQDKLYFARKASGLYCYLNTQDKKIEDKNESGTRAFAVIYKEAA
jgi:hypothetical protein